MQSSVFANEWTVLQNQFDSYEKFSLLIKLVNIVILSGSFWLGSLSIYTLFILLILWLQDAIWKTFQSRIEARLLVLEEQLACEGLAETHQKRAYQFNRQFLASRPGLFGLILVYLRQALKPTVAYPHILLLLIAAIALLVESI